MTENKWESFGDVNPLEHGGKWMCKDGNGYQVIEIEKYDDPEDDEKWFVTDTYVDMEDYKKDGVIARYIDNKGFTAIDVVSYYGAYQLGGDCQEMYGRQNVKHWLESYGIEI